MLEEEVKNKNYSKLNISKEAKEAKEEEIQKIWGIIAKHLEDTYIEMKEVIAVQKDFEEIYSDKDFPSLKEFNNAFGNFVGATKKKNEGP